MRKKILIIILSFLFLGTAVSSGVLLTLNNNTSQSEENNNSGSSDNNYDDGTGATTNVPLSTDGTWLSEGGRFATSFAGGSGTKSDPYEIETADQLAFLSYVVRYANSFYADLYYEQTADIDVSAYYWYPIGTSSTYAFKGNYDGGGYTISGIYTRAGNSSDYNYQGLFGYVAGASSSKLATIQSVIVEDSYIQGYSCLAGIVGYASNTSITNCLNYAKVKASAGSVAGIVGSMVTNVEVEECANYGNILVSDGSSVGGIAGNSSSSTDGNKIARCLNSGNVSVTFTSSTYGNNVGGIVGNASMFNIVEDCYNLGDIKGQTYVGGIVGYFASFNTSTTPVYYAYINNCYNLGEVTAAGTYSGNAGGITGSQLGCISTTTNSSAYVYNCFNLGNVESSLNYAYGITGSNGSGSYISNCYFGGDCTLTSGLSSGSYSNVSKLPTIESDAKSLSWYLDTSEWNSSYTWDFDEIWTISENKNNGYPTLRWANMPSSTSAESWTDEGNYADSFAGGNGTSSSPWQIETPEQLARMAYLVNNSSTNATYRDDYYVQTADLEMGKYYWDAIGYSSTYYFRGYFSGGDYTISGLYTQGGSSSAYSYQGLFGNVYTSSSSYSATIENVNVTDSHIQGYQYVGGIVGYAHGYNIKISDCTFQGVVHSQEINCGGIVGAATGASSSYLINITNCHVSGSVSTEAERVGGIVAYGQYLTISNSSNSASISGSSSGTIYVGGIIGFMSSCSVVEYSFNAGSVDGRGDVGGIAGYSYYDQTGNAIGYSYNTGTITSNSSNIGGIIGCIDSSLIITNCYNIGGISAPSCYAGGIVGYSGIDNSSSYRKNISNCYNTATISAAASRAMGGIVGYSRAGSYIYNSFNVGDVTQRGDENTGGIVGMNNSGYIYNSYWGGDCSSTEAVGINGGSVNDSEHVLDLDVDAKTLTWFILASNWYSLYPWDFDTVWTISEDVNDGYPVFQWEHGKNSPDDSNLWTSYYATGFAGGSGTSSSPWQIATAAQLARVAYLVNSSSYNSTYCDDYYVLTADIDMSAHYWDAIGMSSTYYFRGNFDGQGYTISGLYTQEGSSSTYSYQGLFGRVYASSSSYSATIENVNVTDSYIQGYQYVGGIVGYVYGYNVTISNCTFSGTVSASGSYCGGIVGYSYSPSSSYILDIINCRASGNISSTSLHVGGITGYIGYTTISNCSNTASVYSSYSSSSAYVGGIAGQMGTSSIIEDSYNTGSVSAKGYYVGGIAGCYGIVTSVRSYIRRCYNTGSVTSSYSGSAYVGGIIGWAGYTFTIEDCYNTSDISGYSYVGGIVGYSYGGTSYSSYIRYITNCYNTGTISTTTTGSCYSGGIVGYNYYYSYVYNCFNVGSVTQAGSSGYIGGIVGRNYTSSYVYNSYFGGDCTLSSGVGSNAGTSSNVTRRENLKVEAKKESFFSNSSNWNTSYPWDFDSVWSFDSRFNDGYPILGTSKISTEGGSWIDEGNYADSFAGGSGTSSSPYLIATASQLARLSYLVRYQNSSYASSYYKQIANIDLSAHEWYPIGTLSTSYDFSGHYDGGGFTVSGIYLKSTGDTNSDDQGLFGRVYGLSSTNRATIENVGIVNSVITGNDHVGGIAGNVYYTEISNCYNTSDITVTQGNVGGIVGQALNYSIIENCYNTGNISAPGTNGWSVGGIAGWLSNASDITDCYNTGDIFGNAQQVGGILGCTNVGTSSATMEITNCYNTGTVTSNGYLVGGVVGASYGYIYVTHCYNQGIVYAPNSDHIGGVVGSNTKYSYVQYCYNTGSVTGNDNSGGIVGRNYDYGYVYYCYNTGAITSTNHTAGGVVGYNYDYSYVEYCYNTGGVTGWLNNVGGVTGSNKDRSYTRRCYNTGSVVGHGNNTGGIVGEANTTAYVYNNYNTGYIRGQSGVGGIAGCAVGSSFVRNNFSVGETTGTSNVGGVVGYKTATISNNYYGGNCTASQGVGWDTSTSTSHSTGATNSGTTLFTNAKRKEWYLTSSNWNSSYPWNFSTLFFVIPGVNDGYPVFQWQYEDDYEANSTTTWTGSSSYYDTSWSGAGTSASPWQITSAAELAGVAYRVNNSSYNATFADDYYELTADIDLSARIWVPIGTSSYAFKGHFDGQGHTISGVYNSYTSTSLQYQGLFGYVLGASSSNPATIGDVNLTNSYIQGTQDIGGIVGWAQYCDITNCFNGAKILGDYQSIGGIAGCFQDGAIRDCHNSGLIFGVYNGTSYVGGIAGYTGSVSITDSYNTGDIEAYGSYVGGIVGCTNNSTTILGCYNTAIVTSTYRSGYSYLGGIAGYVNNGTTIDGCSNTGQYVRNNVYSGPYGHVGGIAGHISYSVTIIRCYNSAEINTSSGYIGGIVGYFNKSSVRSYIQRCQNDGAVTSSYTSSTYAGGIVGYSSYGLTVEDCINFGNVSGYSYIGGIVGRSYGNSSYYRYTTNCINIGSVTASSNYAGGILGYSYYSYNYNNINMGAVNCSGSYAGAIVGYNNSSSYVRYCYWGGDCVESSAYGYNGSTVANCSELSSDSNAKLQSWYTTSGNWYSATTFGWDFTSIWQIDNEKNDGYPSLRSVDSELDEIDQGVYWSDSGNYASSFAGGTGTKSDPYQIATAAQLGRLSYLVNNESTYVQYTSLYYEQTADIDLEGYYWKPIGSEESPFKGHFNGNEYTISNMENNNSGLKYQGLFGKLQGASSKICAVVENVIIKDSTIHGQEHNGSIAGAISYATVMNCKNYGTIISEMGNSGGIVGWNSASTVIDCKNYGNVYVSGATCGGIVSLLTDGGIVKNCQNYGVLTSYDSSDWSQIGGIVGAMLGAASYIGYNTNYGSVKSNGCKVGGIAGYNEGSVHHNDNYGSVSSNKYWVGGVVGENRNSVEYCSNHANVNAAGNCVGGIVGTNSSANVYYCYNTGNISGGSSGTGGIVGYTIGDSGNTVAICYNTGNVYGEFNVGGIIGDCNNTTVSESFNSGNIYQTSNGNNCGGVTGGLFNSSLMYNCYNRGSVSGNHAVGGVSGYVPAGNSIYNSFNVGAVTGNTQVGGVVGANGGYFYRCYTGGACSLYGAGTSSGSSNYTSTSNYTYKSSSLGSASAVWSFMKNTGNWNSSYYWNTSNNGWIVASDINDGYPIMSFFYEKDKDPNETWIAEGRYADSFAGGDGSKNNPYLISNAQELARLSYLVLNDNSNYANKYYKQIANIDLSDYIWYPIGLEIARFKGYYDGGEYNIDGLYISGYGYNNSYVGLFGYVENATIENVIIKSGEIKGHWSNGTVVGQGQNVIVDNCVNYATIEKNQVRSQDTGGIVGAVGGLSLISNCINYGDVNGIYTAGGILGWSGSGEATVVNCENHGDITIDGGNVGGIVGGGYVREVINCHNFGDISCGNSPAGGIVSGNIGTTSALFVKDCHNEGNITSTSQWVGGIVGNLENSSAVESCYNTGTIRATNASTIAVSGIVGQLSSSSTVSKCYNTGSVTSVGRDVGGIVGQAITNTSIHDCYNTATISGTATTGGVVGALCDDSTLTNCFNLGTVSMTGTEEKVGGVVGYERDSTIYNCFNTASVTSVVSGGTYIGGVLGMVDGSVTISYCYYGGSCSLSYGIGSSSSNTGASKNSSLTTNAKTESWYESTSNFSSTYPWDFDNVWTINSSVNSGYPSFRESDDDNAAVSGGYWTDYGNFAETFAEGSGTSSDPYIISCEEELALLAHLVNENEMSNEQYASAYYEQTANLDLSAHQWEPIGKSGLPFTGYYDGGGHIISGITMQDAGTSQSSFHGLFGIVGVLLSSDKATITAVGIIDSQIRGYNYVGALVGYATSANITKCYNNADVIASGSYAGGIVGQIGEACIIQDCYNSGRVSGQAYVGGITGATNGVILFLVITRVNIIANCYNKGNLAVTTKSSAYLGGIVGLNYYTRIYNCFNIGALTSSSSTYKYGIAGQGSTNSYIYNSYWGGACTQTSGVSGGTTSSVSKNSSIMTDAKSEEWFAEGIWDSSYSWDFNNTWTFNEKENSGFPILQEFTGKAKNSDTWTDEGNYADSFAGGTGTSTDPWQIATPQQLARVAYLVNNSSTNATYCDDYYILIADIDMSAHYWTPIGTSSYYFRGNFDGQGYTISGLYTQGGSLSTYSRQGLFGHVYTSSSSYSATIENINVADSYIQGYSNVGGIAGYVNGYNITISNCTFSGKVHATGAYCGGIVGYSNGGNSISYINKITNCQNYGAVSSTSSQVGGIAGCMQYTTISHCSNYGKVYSSSGGVAQVGGIAGYMVTSSIIEYCYNIGNVSAAGMYVGGIAGLYMSSSLNGSIRRCYNIGNVSSSYTGGSQVGGIIGRVEFSFAIEDCYNTGNITGYSSVGGIAGYVNANYLYLTNCYNTGAITATTTTTSYSSNVGGIAGYNAYSYIYNCFNVGEVTQSSTGVYIGAIVGYNVQNGYVYNSYFGGNCTLTSGVGHNNGGTYSNVSSISDITTQAKTESWYSSSIWNSAYSWDFSNIWGFVSGENDGYPILRTVGDAPEDTTSLWTDSGNYAGSFAGGSGTSTDPWQISTPQQLARVAYLVNNSSTNSTYRDDYYILTTDINMVEHYWDAIGTSSYYFAGNFDGQGHTISGLYTQAGNSSAYSYQGLFGYARSSGSSYPVIIQNINVRDSYIQGYQYVGGIVGSNVGYNLTISNCTFSGTVSASNSYCGGIVGYANGSSSANPFNITNCHVNGNISSTSARVGGIAGYITNTTISNCSNHGNVSSSYTSSTYIGGVAGGMTTSSIIEDSFNTGNVTSTGSYTGGIVGQYSVKSTIRGYIRRCYNTGNVTSTGNSYVGGIGYTAHSMTIEDCFNTGTIEGNDYVSGIGYSTGTSGYSNYIANCYNIGTIIARNNNADIGGIACSNSYSYIYNCFNLGALVGGSSNYTGGISSRNSNGYIYNSYWGGYCTTTNANGPNYTGTMSNVSRIETISQDAKTEEWYSSSIWNSTYAWDFDNVWVIDESINDGYPVFKWQLGRLNYDLNGGIMDEQEGSVIVAYDRNNNISLPTPTRTGYNFEDWVAKEDASNWVGDLIYVDGLSITGLHGDVTLVAQWSPIRYTITFNPMDGTVYGSTSESYRYYDIEGNTGSDYTNYISSLPTPTRDGYTFNGWKPSASSGTWISSSSYGSGTTLVGKFGDVTLVAQWTPTPYTVTFNANGGSLGSLSSTLSYTIEDTLNFTSTYNDERVTKGGFTLAGWQPATAVGNWNTDTIYPYDEAFTGMWGNVTLNAVWEANNPAYYDEDGDYWYVEIGKMPQTKVTDQEVIDTLEYVDLTTAEEYVPSTGSDVGSGYPMNTSASWTDSGNYATSFAGGSGTAASPYLISTPGQLAYLACVVNNNLTNASGTSYRSLCYRQTTNLDMSAYYWVPIGTSSYSFIGQYDGGNYSISGVYTRDETSTTERHVGLFGYLRGSASSQTVTIENVNVINSYIRGDANVGGIVGYAYYCNIVISNCSFSGKIEDTTTGDGPTGGIVGAVNPGYFNSPPTSNQEYYVRIQNCINYGDIDSYSWYVAGIAGYSQYCIIDNCINKGNITANYNGGNGGGIVGYFSEFSTVQNCYNEGNIYAVGGPTGGIVGGNSGSVSANRYYIYNCYNTGDVTGRNAGGILGSNFGVYEIKNCYNTGDITGTASVGGIVGYFNCSYSGGYLTNCYNKGNILGGTYTGGIVGQNQSGSYVYNCFNMGSVTASTNRGGIAGSSVSTSYIRNCYYGGNCSNIGAIGGSDNATNSVNYVSNLASNVILQSWYTNTSNWYSASSYGWNFTEDWKIVGMVNGGYPFLSDIFEIDYALGDTYNIGGVTLQGYILDGEEYARWNGNWYMVEPIRWRLPGNASQSDGYGTSDDTLAVMDKVVYIGEFPSVTYDPSSVIEDPDFEEKSAPDNNYDWETYFVNTFRNTVDGSGTDEDPYLLSNFDQYMGAVVLAQTDETYTNATFEVVGDMLNGLFAGGAGTEDDPYQIATASHLAGLSVFIANGIASPFASAYYVQTAHIDISACYWIPIGSFSETNTTNLAFTGNYDGNGYVISGMFIDDSVTLIQGLGLFSSVTNATIHDIEIVNSKVNASISNYVGGLIAGAQSSVIYNCSFSGEIIYDSTVTTSCFVGGLVAYCAETMVYASYNTAEISVTINLDSTSSSDAQSAFGGLIGGLSGNVYGSYNSGNVTVNLSSNLAAFGTGGIAGYTSAGTLEDCYNTGDISAVNSGGVGGLFGFVFLAGGNVTNCYNTGDISSVMTYEDTNSYAAGLIGVAGTFNRFYLTNCYNTGSVSAYLAAGLLISGAVYMYNCYNLGSVSGDYVNGLISATTDGSSNSEIFQYISNCYYGGNCANIGASGGLDSEENSVQYLANLSSSAITESWYVSDIWEPNYSWDFDNHWTINENINSGYPTLRPIIVPYADAESSNQLVSDFLNNSGSGIYDSGAYNRYLTEHIAEVDFVFGGSGVESRNESGYIFISSVDELNSICGGDLDVEFSDLVMDMLIENGQLMLYYTRNLGDNIDNVVCLNRVGEEVQRKVGNMLGVRFTIMVSEYGCVV